WTTTPWTLPSNCALAIGPAIRYAKVKTFNAYTHKPVSVILARELLGRYFKADDASLSLEDYRPGDKRIPWKLVSEFGATELLGLRYEQLMPYVSTPELQEKAFRVIPGDFVTTEDGTGIVHTASVF